MEIVGQAAGTRKSLRTKGGSLYFATTWNCTGSAINSSDMGSAPGGGGGGCGFLSWYDARAVYVPGWVKRS
jgi:hypothetical protein